MANFSEKDEKYGKIQKVAVGEAKAKSGAERMNEMDISIAGISKRAKNEVKTTGTKQRGKGAAIKGYTSRGPMG